MLLLLSGCGPAEEASREPSGPQVNVLLVSLDTTRADALGCYGSARGATPVLDALAEESLVFDWAFAPSPLTFPSHCTLLTGLDPPRHRARGNSVYDLHPSATTLAEHLQPHGYHNIAVVASVVLLARHGLDQGFAIYDAESLQTRGSPRSERPAAEITDAAIAHLDGRQPFFAFVHYYDPHQPFAPPADLAERFGREDPVDLYHAEIASVDRELGRLFAHLKQTGLWDNTVVVVTADHGEGLGEHGEMAHGMLLHDATQRVPLIVRHPQREGGRRSAPVVSLADVLPTILDLLELPVPDGGDGLPLLAAEGLSSPRAVYLETLAPQLSYDWSPLYGLRNERFKFILGSVERLHDLQQDPGELHNVAAEQDEVLQEMRTQLLEWIAGRGPPLPEDTRVISGEELALLGGLGYVVESAGVAKEDLTGLVDPYAAIHQKDAFERGFLLLEAGRFEQARETLEPLAKELPDTFLIRRALGTAYGRLGEDARALAEFQAARALRPGSVDIHVQVGLAGLRSGAKEEGRRALRQALGMDACPAQAYFLLANSYYRDSRRERARKVLERLLARPDLVDSERRQAELLLRR